MSQSPNPIFDRNALRVYRSRALKHKKDDADFLLQEAADCLLDRLHDITRSFTSAIDLGAHTGQIAQLLSQSDKVQTITSTETHEAFLTHCPDPKQLIEEDTLPFEDNSAELIMSCMSLHWVNNLPKLLDHIHRVLKPGGLFLATIPGEETLIELRDSFARAELDIEGGVSPRVIPMITIKDAAGLLQAAGFVDCVADRDRVTVDYPDPIKLMHDLRAMGETNAVLERRKSPLKRSTLVRLMEHYQNLHTNENGRCLATFDLVTMTAWKRNN